MARKQSADIQAVFTAKRRRKLWIRITSMMMAVVVFCTTYALILPAITMEKAPACGLQEHVHTDDCYEMLPVVEKRLTCELENGEDIVLHKHDNFCYDEDGRLICNLIEREPHEHTEACFDEDGNLICGKEELLEHTHDESCCDENGDLVCGLAQTVPHQHSDICFEEVTSFQRGYDPICGKAEHVHSDECMDEVDGADGTDRPEMLQFSFEDGGTSGVITLPWATELPEDLNCTVLKLNGTEENYQELFRTAAEALSTEGFPLASVQVYQLEWSSGGEPYRLPAGISPAVHLTLPEEDENTGTITGVVFEESSESLNSNEELIPNAQSEPAEGKEPGHSLAAEDTEAISERTAGGPGDEPENDTAVWEDEDGSLLANRYTATAVPLQNGTATMQLAPVNTFALARASTTAVSGFYYKRVDSIEEIKSHYNDGYTEKYVFIYANGMNQAFGTDNWYWAPMEVQYAKGVENREYATLRYVYEQGYYYNGYRGDQRYCNPVNYKDRHWQIKPHPSNANAFYIWEDENLSDELWTHFWDGNQMFLEHDDVTNTWRIRGKTYYMSYDESNYDAKKTNDKRRLTQTNMLIFRYVGGELDLPEDFDEADVGLGPDGFPEPWSNYEYDHYKDVSGAKTGMLPGEESPVDSATMAYASDPATASVESVLGSKTKTETGEALYRLQKENDGRVLTDKSVVYGGDDYGASGVKGFGAYEKGDFSVTLSALGQEWMITERAYVTTPLDVVYVLDISSSMDKSYAGAPRWDTAMRAINLSMRTVLEYNPQNRVGLVAFSNISEEVLPLDRYVPNGSGDFLEASDRVANYYLQYVDSSGTMQSRANPVRARIQTAAGLRYEGESQSAIRPAGAVPVTDFAFEWGWAKTNTQHGIQSAYKVFQKAADMAPDNLTFEAGDARYPRQPVIILITDGDPTICSLNFMDPQNGPSHGQGESFAVEGYYTILTANYFKNLTSALYQKRTSFFTIGIDSGSDYTRTILEPNARRLGICGTYPGRSNERTLYNLLQEIPGYSGGAFVASLKGVNSYSGGTYWYRANIPGIGFNSALIRGAENPYRGNYNYCDGAWFDTLTEKTLEDILAESLNQTRMINNYNFLLKEGTELTMTDTIGEGMMVKGAPVLSFYGQLYAADNNPTVGTDMDGNKFIIYRWTRTVSRRPSDSKGRDKRVPLGEITAKITTTADGKQTVKFFIPKEAMPTYYPDLYKKFYYEELPVRLIYRVGLSEEEEAKLQSQTGRMEEKTYYTSLYEEASGDAATIVQFIPDPSNPYYQKNVVDEVNKVENTSATMGYSFKEYMDESGMVVQFLGNNGTLTFNRDGVLNLSVQKRWAEGTAAADSVSIVLYASGSRKSSDTEDETAGIWEVATAQLSAENDWTYQWVNFPMKETKDGYTYNYAEFFIKESGSEAYSVTYQDEEGQALIPQSVAIDTNSGESRTINAVPVNGTAITVINAQFYALPHTGGTGTQYHTVSGLLLCSASFVVYMLGRRPSRYRGKGVKKKTP